MDLQGQTRPKKMSLELWGDWKMELVSLALYLSDGDISVNINGAVPLIILILLLNNSKK